MEELTQMQVWNYSNKYSGVVVMATMQLYSTKSKFRF